MDNHSPDAQFQLELEMAKAARAAGNEGRARVCARRAAGIVVGEYFKRRGISSDKSCAYERLRQMRMINDAPGDVLPVIDHFLLRVGTSQQLPVQIDLIEDAEWIKHQLID